MNIDDMSRSELEALLAGEDVVREGVTLGLEWAVEFYAPGSDPDTDEPYRRDVNHNLVVDDGLDKLLDVFFGSDSAPTLYVALKDGTAPASGWGMTEAANNEVTDYDEANRQDATFGSASSQSIDNSGSVAQFTITAGGGTIGGAMLIEGNNTKGDSASGTLISAEEFSGGDESPSGGTIVQVTVTVTAADA